MKQVIYYFLNFFFMFCINVVWVSVRFRSLYWAFCICLFYVLVTPSAAVTRLITPLTVFPTRHPTDIFGTLLASVGYSFVYSTLHRQMWAELVGFGEICWNTDHVLFLLRKLDRIGNTLCLIKTKLWDL